MSDPQFGTELADKAIRAMHNGAGSAEWRDFFWHFATSPEEWRTLSADAAACTYSTCTVTVTSTAFCTTTTTRDKWLVRSILL